MGDTGFQKITTVLLIFSSMLGQSWCIAQSAAFNSGRLAAHNADRPVDSRDPISSRQLLIVLTTGWQSLHGEMYGLEKQKSKWSLQFRNTVVLGKNGMANAKGQVTLPGPVGPAKKEGDGKSPAGIFPLGTAFGYAPPDSAKWMHIPYIQATENMLCIDDTGSVYYNRLVRNDSLKSDWSSFEWMRRQDRYYQWGVFVEYNYPQTSSGMGSCIFLHIWENENEGTAGCTAMSPKDMLRVLHWIDAQKHPLLVQMPREVYRQVFQRLHLPELK